MAAADRSLQPPLPAARTAAVVLLSGGLDSATCLALACRDHDPVHAVSFRYGQRHDIELTAAAALATAAGVDHAVIDIDLRAFGGSALTADVEVPKHDSADDLDDATIPVTYVPARNTIFLSFALALAEVRGADTIYIGVNALDYSGYPDCRPAFIDAFQRMADLATRAGVEHEGGDGRDHAVTIATPLLELSKADIVTLGRELGVDQSLTTSCYDPVVGDDGWAACGRCDSCLLRRKGFAEAGVVDPIAYVDGSPS